MGQHGDLGRTGLTHLLSSPFPLYPDSTSLYTNTTRQEIHVKRIRKVLEMEGWRDNPVGIIATRRAARPIRGFLLWPGVDGGARQMKKLSYLASMYSIHQGNEACQ